MNALGDARVVDYLNDNFVCTYLKVGTFQKIGEQKLGGNVASYFCLADSSVMHAIPGKTDANKLLSEARWAYEVRKLALTFSTDLDSGKPDMRKYVDRVKKAHIERFGAESGWWVGNGTKVNLPATLPRNVTQQGQAHWLLAKNPLPRLETIYPTVWTQVLGEQLSALPVAQR